MPGPSDTVVDAKPRAELGADPKPPWLALTDGLNESRGEKARELGVSGS